LKNTIFKQIIFAISFLILLGLGTSCNEPSVIGAEVVDPDRADVEFTDTLTILASSVTEDSVLTYSSLNLLSSYLCGQLDDPIFGKSTAVINTQLRLTGTPDSTTFEGIADGEVELDSVVFVMAYDTSKFYGTFDTEQEMSIFLLDEDMDNNETYYSNRKFDASELLMSAVVNPSLFDTTFSLISSTGDTINPPQLRIKMEDSNPNNQIFGHPLFDDILFTGDSEQYYEDDETLLSVFRGIQMQSTSTGAGDNDLMMGFDLASTLGGLYLYYTTPSDTLFYRFTVNSNAAQMVSFEHDYSGSIVEPFIDDDNFTGDNLVFIQGMSGLNAKLSIPYARNLQNVIINQAQLEFTIATILPEDQPIFHEDPLQQLLISTKNEDGDLTIIADLEAALNQGSLIGVFGGNLTSTSKNNVVLWQYTMNVSEHLQNIIDGTETSNEIFISALSKAQNAQRSIIFGPEHSTYPIKMNVTFTINQ